MGTCYLHLGETANALELLEESAAAFQANGSLSSYQVSLADIGNLYFVRIEYVKAISYYQRALELARQLGDRLSVSKWLKNLGWCLPSAWQPRICEEIRSRSGFAQQGTDGGAQTWRSRSSLAREYSSLHVRSRAS